MKNTLFDSLYNFLIDSSENHISAVSLVYLAVKENLQIEENQLKSIAEDVTKSAIKKCERNSSHYRIFQRIPHQPARTGFYIHRRMEVLFLVFAMVIEITAFILAFSIAFEAVQTLHNIKSL
ncbi:5481_t:CDS:2, partial [Racocetra persica]